MTPTYERVPRLDPVAVLAQLVEAGGPRCTVVGALPGGAVGAWLVRDARGHEWVLTSSAPRAPGGDNPSLATSMAVMDAARAAGVPVPRYEGAFTIADGGVAVLQERAAGIPAPRATEPVVARLLELTEARHGLALRHGAMPSPRPLFLARDGPGFCLHEPLRVHDARTRDLVERIERVGAGGDVIAGNDAVHFDHHLGNVLVDRDDNDTVTAIVDWGAASWCDIGIDLVILAFDLTRSAPGLSRRVEDVLAARVDERRFTMLWAHAALRLVDWTIRHEPDTIDHWVGVARRHL